MSTGTSSDLSLGDAPMLSLSGKAALCPLQHEFSHFIVGRCYHAEACYIANSPFGGLRSNPYAITHAPARNRDLVYGSRNLFCRHKPLSLSFTEERAKLCKEMDRMVARQHELESKLKQAEEAEAQSRDLEGQLMAEKERTQQAEADKRNAEIQLAQAEKESLAAYRVATNAISGEPPLKRPRVEEKREFTLDGLKCTPVEFKSMDLQGLIYIKTVDVNCHEAIAKNRFFELADLLKSDSLHYRLQRSVTHTEELPDGRVVMYSTPLQGKALEPKMRPELYQLLYTFGQYYLQCFPAKTVGFLEYLTYLTKYCAHLSMPILVSLEMSIRKFYMEHPDLNGNIMQDEMQHLFKNVDQEQEKLNRTANQNRTPNKGRPQQLSPHRSGTKSKRPHRFDQNQPRSQSQSAGSDDTQECRCKNWNFSECRDDPRCYCEHICWYCGAGHKGKHCTQHRSRGRQ